MNERLKNRLEWYMNEYMLIHPVVASHIGLEEYDEMMPDESENSKKKRIRLCEEMKEQLQTIEKAEENSLSFEDITDITALNQIIEENIFYETNLPFSNAFPGAPGNVSAALYTIFSREYMPIHERLRRLERRLEKIPEYLEGSKEMLKEPVEIWVKQGINYCESLPSFINLIINAADESEYPSSDLKKLKESCGKSEEAISRYKKWLLESKLPQSIKDFAIGAEKFQKILELRKFGYTSDELVELGKHYLAITKENIERIGKKIDSNLSYEEIKERIRSDHPSSFDETLEHCRMAMLKSKKYVNESGFATIPEGESLTIKETPSIFKHTTPLAAYIPPGRFHKEQKGVYIVTRTEDPKVMKDFNYTALFNKSIHEGYPGHHLQFSCINRHPSLARIFTASPEFVEGWAHYCEEYVANNGFPDDYKLHFTMNLELIWKAARILIDVKLSSGQMTFEEAVEMLMKEAGFTRFSAVLEVTRYTYTPCYQLSYLLGKHMILKMKDELSKKYSKIFSDREFHDLLLYFGNLPMNVMKRYIESTFENKMKKAVR